MLDNTNINVHLELDKFCTQTKLQHQCYIIVIKNEKNLKCTRFNSEIMNLECHLKLNLQPRRKGATYMCVALFYQK